MVLVDDFEENSHTPIRRGYKVMVSSSILDFEDQLDVLCSYLRSLGYDVLCSKEGTIKADTRLGNFDNCYDAVKCCDLFLGIIRPYTGSGRIGCKSVTFQEFELARAHHKPSWYIVDKRVQWSSEFCRSLKLRNKPLHFPKAITCLLSMYHKAAIIKGKKLPKVLDVFESDDSRRFSEECFEMEKFVNQRGLYKPKAGKAVNNWMQYCSTLSEMKTWLSTNFGNYAMIDSIINEA